MTMLSLRLVTWLQSWLRIVAKWLVTVKSFSRQVAQKRGPSCCFSNNLNAFFVWGPGSDPTTGWIPPQKLTLRNLKVDGCQDCMVNLRVKWSSHHQIDVTSFLEISTPWVRSELGHRGRHDPLKVSDSWTFYNHVIAVVTGRVARKKRQAWESRGVGMVWEAARFMEVVLGRLAHMERWQLVWSSAVEAALMGPSWWCLARLTC